MRQLARLICALSLLACASASAAGLLGSRGSFYNSAFCSQYACSEPYRSGENWSYTLNTGDRAFIQREYGDPQGRISLMALFVSEAAFDADVDRQPSRTCSAPPSASWPTAASWNPATERCRPGCC